jgi:hypothetical protein
MKYQKFTLISRTGTRRSAYQLLTAVWCLAVLLAARPNAPQAIAGGAYAATTASGPAATGVTYVQDPCTPVYAAPDQHSLQLTELLGGTDVTPLNQVHVQRATWQHVLFWSGQAGYINAGQLAARPPTGSDAGSCGFPGVPVPQSVPLPSGNGTWPLPAGTSGVLFAPAPLYTAPGERSRPVARVASGTPVQLLAWAGDKQGHTWYKVATPLLIGWIWSGAVSLNQPNPAVQQMKGQPIWMQVYGKGMWFTNYLPRNSNITALIDAAKLAGVTHLYAEVAITQYGFFGRNTLDRLLPAAHAAGISVIGWVYPNLSNIAGDVRMTQEVAQYVTRSGDRVDGIATDVETVDDTASVFCYGQLLRALLGPDTLLVAAVYHPFAQPYYPYGAIAASWNVIAPMDYWHSRDTRSYSASQVERFVADSITTIRAAMASTPTGVGTVLPVEELGQTYDMYSGDGAGGQAAPTGAEIQYDLQTARALGCIGVSFFEWQTATQAEWASIKQFSW